MPEMPEVEVMTERLQRYAGYNIVAIISMDGAGTRYLPGDERVIVTGQRINGVFRRGKFMVFMLEHGAILAHNAMSGYWDIEGEPWTFDYVEGKRSSKMSDVRCGFILMKDKDPTTGVRLLFHDARKFGSLHYLEPQKLAEKLSKIGPEADHSPNLYEPSTVTSVEQFHNICRNYKKSVKELLLDQSKIAGVGNIYAAEACWYSRIDPHRLSKDLNNMERANLFFAVRSVLRQALERRLDYAGLKIYRRKNCSICQTSVSSDKIKGRTTYWCPKCQT